MVLALSLVFMLAGQSAAPQLATAPHSKPASTTAPKVGAWSKVMAGLRGRLVVTPRTGRRGHQQIKLHVEIENVAGAKTPIELLWGDASNMLQPTATGSDGKPIPLESLVLGVLGLAPRWTWLDPGDQRTVPMCDDCYQYTADGQVHLLLGFEQFDLTGHAPGTVTLNVTLTPPASDEIGHRAWTGPLALPAVLLP